MSKQSKTFRENQVFYINNEIKTLSDELGIEDDQIQILKERHSELVKEISRIDQIIRAKQANVERIEESITRYTRFLQQIKNSVKKTR